MGLLRHREKRLRQFMFMTALRPARRSRAADSTVAKIDRDLCGSSLVTRPGGATVDSILQAFPGDER